FNPATRDGRPVGTYVEFDLVFEPLEPDWVPPDVVAVGAPEVPADFAYEIPEEGPLTVSIPAQIQMEARDLLSVALGASESEVEARLGSLDGLLAGNPPEGVSPLRWRSQAGDALERAMARDPDNPAPALALARIRLKQGLRADARELLGRGLEGAERGTRTISPRLVAELNYEMGRLVRESWLSVANLGEVPDEALAAVACTRRGPGPVGLETLLAWNYVCPVRLGEAMASSFVPSERGVEERRAMVALFRSAVESFPGHVGANVAILLDIADRELWLDLLNGARRFAWDTQGHPYGFLMSGLALQRLGRAEEALEDFEQAFVVLGEDTEVAFRDVSGLGMGEDASDAIWAGLDPILQTEVNEREVEHLARASYAYLRFGDLTSDAARLWLRYGRPATVRAFGRADLRTEFWDYGQGPDVTLSRPATSDERSFTPEGEAYVEELSGVFPHWYGARARPLYSLPAQAVRFRGLEPGTADIEVQLDVPPALETFESDSLDIGLFLLAADGSALSATTRRIAGDNVRLRTAAGPDVAGVVVELYNARTHEAAALRMPAFRGTEVGDDPRVSDLWLVEAAATEEREVSRNDRWLRPLPRPDVIDDEEVGLFFELYDLPVDEGRFYRIAVELVSEASGEVVALPYRPSGQELFGTEWTRSTSGYPGGSTEYVTVDLSAAQPGVYELRVTAELASGETVSTSLSGVRLRVARDEADEDGRRVGLMSGLEMY
ncbi:MAG: hypothetical protein HKN71_11560, partial [Gemmatimonadetes bacterium]|nr:hypothetical protein [Gemmatimonadota bacterium]